VFEAWNSADKKTTVIDRETRAKETSVAYLEIIKFSGRSLGVCSADVCRETVTPVDAVEIHHQS